MAPQSERQRIIEHIETARQALLQAIDDLAAHDASRSGEDLRPRFRISSFEVDRYTIRGIGKSRGVSWSI